MNLMGYNKSFQGVVRSIGWGIYVQDGSGSGVTALLPSISQTVDWVRLPQRFPVRIQPIGVPPDELRIGQTVSVSLTNAIAQAEKMETKPGTKP